MREQYNSGEVVMTEDERTELAYQMRQSYTGKLPASAMRRTSTYFSEMFAKYPKEYAEIAERVRREVNESMIKYGYA